MKKNEFDLSQPTRQSYAAILIITYRLYRVIARQLFPLLIFFLVKGSLGKSDTFLISIIAVASLGAVYSIIAFFRYYFYLEEDKLIVKKGVFKRTTLEIPFDRIQSINFEQNVIHRIFKVVKLNMDTAGSTSNELQLNALDKKMAQALSQKILENRKQIPGTIETEVQTEEREQVFQLNIWQLIKVGLTENHLRSGGVILFFFFWIYDSLREVGLDFKDKLEEFMPMAQEMSKSLVFVLFVTLVFLLGSLLVSMVRTVLRFYNLKMFRRGDGFSIVNGLISKKEQAAKDQKIQIFKWSQNLLQSLSNIFEVNMKQASSGEGRQRSAFKVVGLSESDLENTRDYLFNEGLDELDEAPVIKVEFYYLFKRIYYWTLGSLIIGFLVYQFNKSQHIPYVVLFWAYGLLRSYLSYKKINFRIASRVLEINGGTFGKSRSYIYNYKIQNTKINNTPFQRRRNLSSLVLYTASGSLLLPDIKTSLAKQIQDYLIYKVEASGERWM